MTQNDLTCYDSGQAASRDNMVFGAKEFCTQYNEFLYKSNDFQALELNFGWDEQHKAGLNMLVRLELKSNCQWRVDEGECNKQLLRIIDGCDQNTIADKQGGVLENNCLAWRIDPEYNQDIAPPAPPPKPEPTPKPEPEPSKPPVHNGYHPYYDILTYDLGASAGTVGRFGRLGLASYEDVDVCRSATAWEDDDASTPKMFDEMKGITGVFGDTCDYKSVKDYADAESGSVVGKLECAKWVDADCYKSTHIERCVFTAMFTRVICRWTNAH